MAVTNPNNWHWVDKNCLEWARGYFEHSLVGIEKSGVKLVKIEALEGDCEVCQRKGKVISLYDMKLVVEYESATCKGTITVPEVMYDTEEDEYQFQIDERVDEPTRKTIRSEVVPAMREVLKDFGPTLINVHGSDIQVDESEVMSTFTKGNQAQTQHMKPVVKERTTFNKGASPVERKPLPKFAQGYNVTSLSFTAEFNTTAEQLYRTLLEADRIQMWTRGPAGGAEAKVGAEFALFGGGVECKVIGLTPYTQIVMYWRLASWKAGHYVKVTYDMKQGSGTTVMDVSMEGVPIGEEDVVTNNFNEKYIRAIKVTFGFGAVL